MRKIILFLLVFAACSDAAEKADELPQTTLPVNWETAFKQATSFREETELLEALILLDSTETYQQLIANRLQTFDLRHLKTVDQLTILRLYEWSFIHNKKPSPSVTQTAKAKLETIQMIENESLREAVTNVYKAIDNKDLLHK